MYTDQNKNKQEILLTFSFEDESHFNFETDDNYISSIKKEIQESIKLSTVKWSSKKAKTKYLRKENITAEIKFYDFYNINQITEAEIKAYILNKIGYLSGHKLKTISSDRDISIISIFVSMEKDRILIDFSFFF